MQDKTTLYVVAFPLLSTADLECIQRWRSRYDAQAKLMAPHFTLVFGCDALPLAPFTEHVGAIAGQMRPIPFECRRLIPGAAFDGRTFHVFLVPDQGSAEISRLHDQLYGGPLTPCLREDLPYSPHITIASGLTADAAQLLCEELGAGGITIKGTINSLSVGSIRNEAFEVHSTFTAS